MVPSKSTRWGFSITPTVIRISHSCLPKAGIKGSPQREKYTIDKVELNVPVDDASFKMPAAAPAPPSKPEAGKPEEKKEPPKD